MVLTAEPPVLAWVVALAALLVAIAGVLARTVSAARATAAAATVDDLLEVRRRLAAAPAREIDRAIVREARGLVDADGAALLHRSAAGGLAVGTEQPAVVVEDQLGEGVIARVAATGRPGREVGDDPALAGGAAAVLAVALARPGQVEAVLVLRRSPDAPFSATEEATLAAMVAVAGDALVRARRSEGAGAVGLVDGSTGIGTAARFERELPEVIAEAETRAHITGLAVAVVDGGPVDDVAMGTLVDVVRASLRPTDRCYHLDERSLAVVMGATDLATACQVAERVRGAVAEAAAGGAAPATVSFGVSSCTGGDPARVVARARAACGEATAAGGDRVVARW